MVQYFQWRFHLCYCCGQLACRQLAANENYSSALCAVLADTMVAVITELRQFISIRGLISSYRFKTLLQMVKYVHLKLFK